MIAPNGLIGPKSNTSEEDKRVLEWLARTPPASDAERKNKAVQQSLHEIFHVKNEEIFNLLLKKGAQARDMLSGSTMLHLAAADKNKSWLIPSLLEKGMDINAKDVNSNTPLHEAIFNTNAHAVSWLLDKQAEVNVKDRNGNTPLHYAATANDPEVVSMLLEKGGDVNAQNTDGDTPLHNAVLHADKDIISLLLDKGASFSVQNKDGYTPINNATPELAKLLISKAKSEGQDLGIMLCDAVLSGDIESVKFLIENGADINAPTADNRTPIYEACVNKRYDIIKELLSKNCDLNILPNGAMTLLDALGSDNQQQASKHKEAYKLLSTAIEHNNAPKQITRAKPTKGGYSKVNSDGDKHGVSGVRY